MNNLSQASKDLKKKLSFNDYSTPASQQDNSNLAAKNAQNDDKLSVMPNGQNASNLVANNLQVETISPSGINYQNAVSLANDHTSNLTTSQQVQQVVKSMPNEQPLGGLSNIAASSIRGKRLKQLPSPKVKVTHYLSEDEEQMLTDIYIKRLQMKKKTDKSALIAEAINLLFKKEMK